MRRLMKFVHTLAAVGLTGGLAAYMVLLVVAAGLDSPDSYVAVAAGLERLGRWLIVPSMFVALVSGLLAMVVHHPFQNAAWVWFKALLGLPIFEATLGAVDARARGIAAAAAQAATGDGDPAAVAEMFTREWGAYWLIAALCVAQIVLGIWRPRTGARRPARA